MTRLHTIHNPTRNETFIVDRYNQEVCPYCGNSTCNGCEEPCVHCGIDVAYSHPELEYLHIDTEHARCKDLPTFAAPVSENYED